MGKKKNLPPQRRPFFKSKAVQCSLAVVVVVAALVLATTSGPSLPDVDTAGFKCPVSRKTAEQLRNTGMQAGSAGKDNIAIICLSEAAMVDPYHLDTRKALCGAYQNRNINDRHGNMMHIQDELQCYDDWDKYFPPNGETDYKRGAVWLQRGEFDKAAPEMERALERWPGNIDFRNDLAYVLSRIGRVDEAVKHMKKAIELKPSDLSAYNNLGGLYHEAGRFDEGAEILRQALAIEPTKLTSTQNSGLWSSLAKTLYDANRVDESIETSLKAIELDPKNPRLYLDVAHSYMNKKMNEKSLDYYKKSFEVKPNKDNIIWYMYQSMQMVRWENREQLYVMTKRVLKVEMETPETTFNRITLPPFMALAVGLNQQVIHESAKSAARAAIIRQAGTAAKLSFKAPPLENGVINVGYVSSDLGEHPVGLTMEGMFKRHDRKRFKVFCYLLQNLGGKDDKGVALAGVDKGCDVKEFIPINIPHEVVAKRIHEHRIHILVDLNGHTKGGRIDLFALRPAPIQVSYLGYCSSYGASFMDYYVGDALSSPPSLAKYWTEKLVYMPHSYLVTSHRDQFPDALKWNRKGTDLGKLRKEYDLPGDKFVLAAYNSLYKIDPAILQVWANILKRAPNAVLYMNKALPAGVEPLRKELEAMGVSKDQVVWGGFVQFEKKIEKFSAADLFLDTPMYNGHTTSNDFLWAGVPVVTMPLDTMPTRVAAGLVTHSGTPELVAESARAYEDLVVSLAANPKRYAKLRAKVENNRHSSPLFDTDRWTRNLENAYEEMWSLHEQGKKPKSFYVKDSSK